MSIYATSDLHSYPLKKLQNKLEEIEFGPKDHLYVLGDCIDRGTDGLQLLRWVMSQPNVTFLLGNHEAMLLDNWFLFDGDSIPSVLDLKGEQRNKYAVWTSNGGYQTLDQIQQFTDAQILNIYSDFLKMFPFTKRLR